MSQNWIARLLGSFISLFRRTQEHDEGKPASGVDQHFVHSREPHLGADPQPAPMPAETRAALEDIMASPVGDRIRNRRGRGTPLALVLAEAPDVAFSTLEEKLYYTTDVEAFLQSRDPEPLPHTLASLLAHGLGYLVGNLDGKTIPEEWRYVVEHFENPYREFKGLPLRSSEPPTGR